VSITRVRGFQDVQGLPAALASHVESLGRKLAARYNIQEIRLPLVERAELFQRSSGETSDIVEKQMYVFAEGDEDSQLVALRPEGTPGVVRAFIEAGLDRRDPEQRYYYSGPMFRRERPQKGRYRQFNQFGVEVFGRADPACDAELLILIDDLRKALELTLRTEINSLGCAECRPKFREALLEYGRQHWAELCDDCHGRIERNPLRLLDCKIDVKLAQSAPNSLDYLCEACRTHFNKVQEFLSTAGVEFFINPRLVRGLDYYTRTAFEVLSGDVGSQSAVVAGGRYDGLIEALGGAAIPGIGFAIGVERLALAVEGKQQGDSVSLEQLPSAVGSARPDAVMIALGDRALTHITRLARGLRNSDLKIEVSSPERKLKALLGRASKLGARFAVIIGDNELDKGVAQVRDLGKGEQFEAAEADLSRVLRPA
jgi:histidyl-tRNA synthetase